MSHACTRTEAALALASALDGSQIHGVKTNRDFLAALLRDPDYLDGATRTDFLDGHQHLLDPPTATAWLVHLAAAVAVRTARRRSTDPLRGHAPPGYRPLAARTLTRAAWRREGTDGPLDVGYRLRGWTDDTQLLLEVDGTTHSFDLLRLDEDGVTVRHDGVDHPCTVRVHPDDSVWVNDPSTQTGWHQEPRLPDPDATTATALGPVNEIPGTVVDIAVAVGDAVVAGQKLVVVEAMKMEHPATAAVAGVVEEIHVSVGDYVDAHTVLVTLGAGADA